MLGYNATQAWKVYSALELEGLTQEQAKDRVNACEVLPANRYTEIKLIEDLN